MDPEMRALGCLMGHAVGDALGAPLMFMTEPQIQIRHGTVRDLIGGGCLLLRPGETTDDTALALLLARSLAEKGRLDPEDVARRYGEWYGGGRKEVRGVLRTSLALLAEGTPPADVARRAHDLMNEETGDNGTVMRCAPLAVLYGTAFDELMGAAVQEAAITHHDARAGAGSAALCVLLALLIDGIEPAEAVDRTFEVLEGNSLGIENLLPNVARKARTDLRPTADVVDTLETAIWHLLHGEDLEDTLVRTANLGGESDTTTAIAGSLAGAARGAKAIPNRWLRALSGRTAIRSLADDLLRARG